MRRLRTFSHRIENFIDEIFQNCDNFLVTVYLHNINTGLAKNHISIFFGNYWYSCMTETYILINSIITFLIQPEVFLTHGF